MKIINTSKAPAPAGHYSQGIMQGNMLFVSGQLPIDPETGKHQLGAIEDQALLAFKNMEAIVLEAGLQLTDIVKTTVYISNIELWPSVNGVYAEFFGDHKPARAIVPSRELHHGAKVEIEAIAIKS